MFLIRFQVFKHATLFFSRDTPSISTVIPVMDHIDRYLAMTIQDDSISVGLQGALALGKRGDASYLGVLVTGS